ncbi:MAG: ANTAR domain-containing response regulator [Solirubrobacterales bacterium]
MQSYKIVVADSDEKSRDKICSMLKSKGYMVYQASDSGGAIRISKSIFPELVIMDINLTGLNAYKSAKIIEEDEISSVVFITNKVDSVFYDKLKAMNIYAYINKPVNFEQLVQVVEFSINNIIRLNELKNKIESLETTLKNRKKLDRAKGIIMKRLNVSEDEAYGYLRKKSMDMCVSIDSLVDAILKKYG